MISAANDTAGEPVGSAATRRPRPVLGLYITVTLNLASIVLLAGFLVSMTDTQLAIGREVMATRLRTALTQLQDRLSHEQADGAVRPLLQVTAAEAPFSDVVLLDEGMKVRIGARHRDDGADASTLKGFDAETARRALRSGSLVLDPRPDLRRLGGYLPLPAASGDAQPRVLYGSFDLSVDRGRIEVVARNIALRGTAALVVMAILLSTLLRGVVIDRLVRIKESMAAFARGDFARRSEVDWNDEIGNFAGSFNEMASRVELEYRRILESRERYQQVVEGTEDLVYVLDPEGTVLFINSASREILGREPGDCVGLPSFEFLHPDNLEKVQAWTMELTAAKATRSSTRMLVLHRDGSVRHLQVSARKVLENDGSIRQIEAIARDVTAVVEAEAARDGESRRFKALFRGARDAIVLCDAATGAVIDVNAAAETLAGLPRDRIVGRHYTMFVPEAAVDVLRSGEPLVRTQVARPGGTVVPVEMSASRVELPDGSVVDQVYLRDVRERQQFEERLMHAERMSVVGQLAGGVAHDFNNQLAGILGFAELLALRLPEGQLRGYAERILTAAQRSSELTRQLLAFSRKGRHAQDPVDLHELLREVAGILERSIDPRVHLHLELGAASSVVLGDSTQLQNALLNLGVNARDAMPDGGDLVFATHDFAGGDWIEVTVRDTGCGMDPATLAHAFEPFFTTKAVGSGTGMGLAAVYGTVTGHGGTVELTSTPGRGTACTLRFPLIAAAAGSQPGAETAVADDSHRERARVLVVDDEEPVRAVISEMLASGGHEAVTCDGGRAAIEKVGAQPQLWDLVLLDLRMPDLSGEETMARLREIRPSLRILLMSGYAPDEVALKLRREGARGLLRKPCNRGDLLDAVRDALGDD